MEKAIRQGLVNRILVLAGMTRASAAAPKLRTKLVREGRGLDLTE
jgi:hypothetical protein